MGIIKCEFKCSGTIRMCFVLIDQKQQMKKEEEGREEDTESAEENAENKRR